MSWETVLQTGGILLTEDTAMKTLVQGLREKEQEAGIVLTTDPSSSYSTVFSRVNGSFCSSFDQALVELAPNFLNDSNQPYAADLMTLAEAVGDNRVITCYVDNNTPFKYQANITAAYISQRAAMLNLLVTPAFDIYSLPVIVKSAKVILPTNDYANDPTGEWTSEDITIASVTNAGVVTVVSEGTCQLSFVGNGTGVSGTITVRCLLEPNVSDNLIKQSSINGTSNNVTYAGWCYNTAVETEYGVTVLFMGYQLSSGDYGEVTINGTMNQAATIPICPKNSYNFIGSYTHSDIEGDLLLWVEECSGTCTIDRGRVYVEFCTRHETSGKTTEGLYEVVLYSFDQPVQITRAKLIKNDITSISGIRIFAPIGTVFDNYTIKIGIKKWSKLGITHDCGLLESYIQPINSFRKIETNTPFYRLQDGSFVIGTATAVKFLNYSQNGEFVTSLSSPCRTSQYSTADILDSGVVIAEAGKILRFTCEVLDKDFDLGTGYICFGLLYADGNRAATIVYYDSANGGYTGKTSTSFIAEQDINTLFCGSKATVISTSPQSLGLRVAFKLEEVNLDDLDLESIELFNDVLMVNQGDVYAKYEPEAIIGSPVASELEWTSSNEDVATIDSTGHITIHSQGNVSFTATSVKHPDITATTSLIECYVSQDDNIIENLIKVTPNATYSQVGLTCTLNEDGTVTLNGTTTASDNTYIRNVIWPLGNSKTAWNVHFLRPGISGMLLVWFEYVSGSVEGVSSFNSGTIFSEIYIMNHGGTELSSIKVRRMVDLYSTASTNNFAMKSATNDTNGLRCIVFGCQFKKGTKFNNFRFKLGVKKITPLTYHASVLEAYMPALTKFVKMNPNNNTIWTRYPDGSIGGYLTESLTSFPTGSGYVRVTKDLAYNSSLSNLLTGDEIGVVGHNYRLTVNLITFKYDRINTTECKFGIAYTDGTIATEVPIVDTSDYTSNTSNTVLSGSYTGTFLAEKQIDCVYQYYKNLKIKGNAEYFAIALDDLDAYTINAGQTVNINSATEYNEIVVNSGGSLVVSSGGELNRVVVNNGGYVRVLSDGVISSAIENGGQLIDNSGAIVSYESNVISGKTLNNVTVHSGTTVTNCVANKTYVYSSGSIISTTLNNGWSYIDEGGYASALILDETSNFTGLEIYNSGIIDSVVVNSNTELDVYENGSATNILENGGYVSIDDNCTYSFVPNVISNFVVTDSWATIHENTVMNNATLNTNDDWGGLEIHSGGIASDVVLSRGELEVHSGGTAYDVDHIPGYGSEDIRDGAVVTYKSSYAGVYYASNYELVSSALVMSDLNVSKGETYLVLSGGITSNAIINASGLVKVCDSGLADNNTIKNKGLLDVSSGGIACNTIVSSGGRMNVYSNATMSGTNKICSGGRVYFQSGASVVYDLRSRVPEDPAILQIESGATATTLNQINSHIVIIDENQTRGSYSLITSCTNLTSSDTFNLYNTSNTYLGTISSGTIVYAGRNQYSVNLSEYTLVLNKVFWLPPVSSGYIVSSGEVLTVPEGQWYKDVTVESGGTMTFDSNGSADIVTVNFGGSMYLSATNSVTQLLANGGCINGWIAQVEYIPHTFSSYVYNSGNTGTIHSGVTGTSLTVNYGGRIKVYEGGKAVNITENGGVVDLYTSNITFARNTLTGITSETGDTTVHSGTTMLNYSRMSNGYTTVFSRGITSNCEFNHGRLYISEGAIVNNVTIKYAASCYIYPGATVNNLSKTGGYVYVYSSSVLSNMICLETDTHTNNFIQIDSGGKITGKVLWTDGKFIVSSGGIIDFNITSQYPHSAIVSGLSRANTPFEPVYTITINSGNYYGPFILTDAFPDDYTSSIVMYDSAGTSVGEIYPNSSAIINDVPYNLELEEGLLTLTKQGRMLYVSGSNVELSPGEVYDYAYVVSGDLVISSGASVGFVNVEYTGYVNKLKWGGIGAVRENGGRFNYTDASPIAPNVISGLNVTTVSKNISIHSGTTGVDITLGSGLSCYLGGSFLGGTINNMTVQNGGIVAGLNPGGYVIDGLVFESGGHLQLYGRGINATNIVITDDTTWAIDNFPDNVIQITSGGSTRYFTSGGFVNNLTVRRGCALYNYAIASDITVDSGYIKCDSSFIVDNLYLTSAVNNNTTIAEFLKGIANHVTLFKGKVYQQAPNLCSNTILSGGSWEQKPFNWMINTEINGGVLNMTGANCSNFDATISSGGRMYVNGYASNVIVSSGGNLIISSGATAVNVVSNAGAFITSDVGAYVTYTSNTTPGIFTIISSGQSVTLDNENSSGYIVAGGGNFVITNSAIVSRVLCLGSTTIFSSGSAYDIIINANTDVVVKTKGYVSGAKIYGNYANMHISSGGIAENVRTFKDGNILLSSGGFVSNAWIFGWFDLYGGSASSVYVLANTGQGMRIRPGASAYNVDIVSDGKVQVISSGYADGVVVSSGGILIVSSGGTAYNVESQIDAQITVQNGGLITYTDPSYAFISSGASVVVSEASEEKYHILRSGSLKIISDGVVSDTVCYGYVNIVSGGIASNTDMYGGTININNGVADGISANAFTESNVIYLPSVYVSSGGTAIDLDLGSRGYLYVNTDGVVSSATIHNSVSAYVSNNGSISDLINMGSVYVGSDGVLSDVAIRSGGYLNVASGGSALNVTYIPTEGTIYVADGGYITYTNILTGVYYGSNHTLVSHAESMSGKTIGSNATMEIFNSGIASNNTINVSGSVTILSGGILSSTVINNAGRLYISSGGIADVVTINSGGSMLVSSGGTATHINANAAACLKLYIASDTYITGSKAGVPFEFINGTCDSYALGVNWNGLHVLSGCSLNSITISHYGSVYVSGGSINTAILNGSQAYLTVSSGATVTSVTVTNGTLHVRDNATATNIINSGGSVIISSGAIVDNVIASGGSVYISSGATATNVTENGGHVGINSDANVTLASNTFEGLTLSGYGYATIHSNTIASNIILTSTRHMLVYSGGIAENITANIRCCVSVYSGGTATIKENGGYIKFDDGANITFVSNHISGLLLNTNTSATIHSGTIAEDVTLSSGFVMEVYSDGICSNPVLSLGTLKVYSGGTALNIAYSPMNSCDVESHEGAYVTYASQYTGVMYVSETSQCVVDSLSNVSISWSSIAPVCVLDSGVIDTASMTAGNLKVRSGGVVRNVSINVSANAAYLDAYAGGLFENVSMVNDANGYCSMNLHPQASASNIVVGKQTRLVISSGAVATDIVENGGQVIVVEGATATFASAILSGTLSYCSVVTIHSNTTLSNAELVGDYSVSCLIDGGTIKDTIISANFISASNGYMSNVTFGGHPYNVFLMGSEIVASDINFAYGNVYLTQGSFTNVHMSTWTAISDSAHVDSAECREFLRVENATINNLDINNTGQVVVYSDGIVTSTNIYAGAMMCTTGCVVNGVAIHDEGALHISSNATVSNIVVSSNGMLLVHNTGSALNVVSHEGAIISALDGAYITYA